MIKVTDFNILYETEVDFLNDEVLWVSFIRNKDLYRIEISSRHERIGFKNLKHRSEAEVMQKEIACQLFKCLDIDTAIDLISLGFKYSSIREIMFVINTRFVEYQAHEIDVLKKKYYFRNTPGLAQMIMDPSLMEHGMHIFFPGHTLPIATFQPKTKDDSSLFVFNLNPAYHLFD
jgi:hypothetical protein